MQPCSPSPSKQHQTPLSPPQTGPSKASSFFSFFSPSKSFGRLSNAAQASPSRSIKLASVIMQAAANSAGGVAAGEVLRAVSRLDGIVGHQLSEATVRFSTSMAMKRATTGSSHFQKHSESAFNAKVAAESLAVTWLVAMQTHHPCIVDEDSCEHRLLPHAEAKMQHIEQNLEKVFGSDFSQDLQRFWNVAADKQTLQQLYSNRQHEDVRQFMAAITDCLSEEAREAVLCITQGVKQRDLEFICAKQ